MNVTVRFGCGSGSCDSFFPTVPAVPGGSNPLVPSVENSTFWSLGGMAAEPRGGVHNSGVWGLKLAQRVLPRVLLWGGARSYMEE